jgi:hypothetical protein
MGPKALIFIHSLARKSLTKGQGSGITKIPSAMQAEAKASEIFTNLVEAGLKPEMMDDFIKSEADVAKYLNILDAYKRERMKPIPADSSRGREITEALFGKRGTVVDMKGKVIPKGSGIMGGESIESLMKSEDVTKKSKKVTDRDMFKAANENYITDTISKIKSMDPIEAMKEANKVIKREGPYKNLNQQQAKKILEDTEDHIFERDVTPMDEDFAAGGVAGLLGERTGYAQGTDVFRRQKKEIPEEIKKKIFEMIIGTRNLGKVIENSERTKSRIGSEGVKAYGLANGGRAEFKGGGMDMGAGSSKSSKSSGPAGGASSGGNYGGNNFKSDRDDNREQYRAQGQYSRPPSTPSGGGGMDASRAQFQPQFGPQLFNSQGLGVTPFNLSNKNFAKLVGPALIQYRILQKKQAMEPLGGDPFTPQDQNMLDKLNQMEEEEKIYSFPITAANGGRVGLRYGGDTMGGINDKSISSPGPDRFKVSEQQELNNQEAISRARDSQQYDYTAPKQIAKDIAINTGKNLIGKKIASTLGIGTGPIGVLIALKGLYDQTKNPVYSEEDVTYGFPYQTGGRVGLAGGMTRRAFLKLMGGVAAGIGAVKSGIMGVGKKGVAKKVVKEVIKTPNAPGKPEWFDALVNKVILEGDDVTKKLAIKDRQTVHTKKIDNDSEVTVYRNLDDDSVRVEYNSPDVMLDEPVSLTVKPGQADETIKKAPPAEFETYEQGFVARSNGPDDYSIDPEPMIGNSIKDLETDVTKLKEFATGEKQTLKEFVQSKKRKDKVKKINQGDIGETSDYVTKRQGDYYPEYDDYASGGIAGMLGE